MLNLTIRINIRKWNGATSKGIPCANEDVISSRIRNLVLKVAFVNSYFDGSDYENPIKDYLDDRIYDYLNDNSQKIIFAYVKQNTATVQDDIFDYSLNGVDSKFNCNYILIGLK